MKHLFYPHPWHHFLYRNAIFSVRHALILFYVLTLGSGILGGIAKFLPTAFAQQIVDDSYEVINRLPAQALPQIMESTFHENLNLEIAQEQKIVAREGLRQAAYRLFPQLNVSMTNRDYDRENVQATQDGLTRESQTISLKQKLLNGGVSSYEYRAAKHDHHIATYRLRQSERNVLMSIIAGYTDLYIAHEIVGIAQSNLIRLEQHYEATAQRSQLGSASITELRQASARKENGTASLIQAQINLVTALNNFTNLNGRDLDFRPIKPEISAKDYTNIPQNLADAIALTLENDANLKILSAETAKARALKQAAPFAFLPNVSLSVGQTQSLDTSLSLNEQTDNYVDINFNYNISPGKASSAYRQASANLRSAEKNLTQKRRETESAATVAWNNFIASRASLKARSLARQASQLAFEGTQTEYNLGRRSQLELLDAQDDLLVAEQSYIQAVGEEVKHYYRLHQTIGTLSFAEFTASN